jgi:hypothetical protein
MVRKVLAAAVFIAALSASALSIQQLRISSRVIAACGASCIKTTACQKPCGLCYIVSGTTGVCQPEGPPPPPNLKKK